MVGLLYDITRRYCQDFDRLSLMLNRTVAEGEREKSRKCRKTLQSPRPPFLWENRPLVRLNYGKDVFTTCHSDKVNKDTKASEITITSKCAHYLFAWLFFWGTILKPSEQNSRKQQLLVCDNDKNNKYCLSRRENDMFDSGLFRAMAQKRVAENFMMQILKSGRSKVIKKW